MDINKLISLLSSARLPLNKEKDTQDAIEKLFKKHLIPYEREYRLDENNIPDFFVEGIVIEVKSKGNVTHIFKQCERYCEFESVSKLILVTTRSIGFPKEINYRPSFVINIGKVRL